MDEFVDDGSRRRGFIGWAARHPFISAALLLLLLLAAGVFVADIGAGRQRNRQLQAIRKQGDPVTVQDLIAAERPPPANENRTPGLMTAANTFAALKPADDKFKNIPYLGGARNGPTGKRMPPEQIADSEWYLSHEPQALADMHQACKLPFGWLDFRWSSPILFMHLPGLSTLRHASKVLALDTMRAAERDDSAGALSRLLDCYRCAGAMDDNRYRPFIASLVRIAIAALSLNVTERAINRLQFDDTALTEIQERILPWCRPDNWADSIAVERVCLIDAHGQARSANIDNWQVTLIPVLRHMDARASVAHLSDLIEAVRTPEPGTMGAVRKCAARPRPPEYYLFTKLLLADCTRGVILGYRLAAEARALSTAIACERFRLKHNRWPTALPDLVPEFLAEVPLDPFDNQPIRYSEIPEGIKLWSISENGKDDGGDVRRLGPFESKTKPPDSGWVILNPDLRGRS